MCRFLLLSMGWFVSSHVAPGMTSQTKKQLNEQSVRRWRIHLSRWSQTEMCVLDNTAQGRGQGKKQAHLEDSWQGAGVIEKEARRDVGNNL